MIKKTIFFFLLSFSTFSLFLTAREIKLTKVSGQVFLVRENKTIIINEGYSLKRGDTLMTDTSTTIELTEEKKGTYYLSGGSQLSLEEKSFKLVQGHLWTKVESPIPFVVNTPNARLLTNYGDGIISFLSEKNKTQVFSFKGQFFIESTISENTFPSREIVQGNFSFYDESLISEGPRAATPIGYQSFLNITDMFSNMIDINKKEYNFNEPQRSLASMPATPMNAHSKISNKKLSDKLKNQVFEEFKKLKKKSSPKKKIKKIELLTFHVPTKKRNYKKIQKKKKTVKRSIASSAPLKKKRASLQSQESDLLKSLKSFDKSYKKTEKEQQKHPDTVNQLIQELESFKMDYDPNH